MLCSVINYGALMVMDCPSHKPEKPSHKNNTSTNKRLQNDLLIINLKIQTGHVLMERMFYFTGRERNRKKNGNYESAQSSDTQNGL